MKIQKQIYESDGKNTIYNRPQRKVIRLINERFNNKPRIREGKTDLEIATEFARQLGHKNIWEMINNQEG